MPKYVFECPTCGPFKRTLPMGGNAEYPCPSCHNSAPRFWPGQGFSHSFEVPPTAAPANTGVAKDDYPTADRAVGVSADARWAEHRARDSVKEKVREVGENRALIRKHGKENGKPYLEYEAGTKTLIEKRRKLVDEASRAYKEKTE